MPSWTIDVQPIGSLAVMKYPVTKDIKKMLECPVPKLNLKLHKRITTNILLAYRQMIYRD